MLVIGDRKLCASVPAGADSAGHTVSLGHQRRTGGTIESPESKQLLSPEINRLNGVKQLKTDAHMERI